MRTLILIFALAVAACFSGCDIVNPKEQVPTYVHIDSFRFTQTGDSFGTNSHKITNIWVYVNNDQIGTYTLPCTVPVIADKAFVLSVAPGIDFNGLGGLKGIYPFYTFDAVKIDPQPGKIVQVDAKTKYSSITRVLFTLTFDGGASSQFLKVAGDDSLRTTTDPNYVFEGTGSAYLNLVGNQKFSENVTSGYFNAGVGQNVFLELNYKCSIPFRVGLATTDASGKPVVDYFAGINVKPTWDKIYIALQDFINQNQGRPFYVVLRAGTDYDEQGGYVTIDNLKVIAF